MDTPGRNSSMAERITSAPVRYPFSFVVAGDSGAWPDPTADGIYSQLLRQVAELDPAPVFFANLGDFAGPGTPDRHQHYQRLVEGLQVPNICVVGNHDLDDAVGPDAWAQVHGPMNFDFAYGNTHFVVLQGAPGEVGEVDIRVDVPVEGPREEALGFLERSLEGAQAPNRVVLTHMPPSLGGHYEPHPEWGFERREDEFLELLRRHRVGLVCCAHGLAFDHHVRDGVRFVMSGGGGTGLCSDFRGICAEGDGHPADRGSLFHAVQIEVAEDGAVSGRVLQAFEPDPGRARLRF
jgi:calcineurin-like phosphoesterase family protein